MSHYHVKTASLMGANTSRPIPSRELATWLAEEIESAIWSQGLEANTRVDTLHCRQACNGTPAPEAVAR